MQHPRIQALRHFVTGICGAAISSALTIATPAYGQPATDWPNRPIRLVVPFPAGSSPDIIARVVARPLSKALGQSIVVENRVGAGGNIGAATVAHSAPDGYTVLFTNGALATAPALYSKLNYRPLEDLAPVTLVATSPNVLVVTPDLNVDSVAALSRLIRAEPGKLNYGSVGPGTSSHLAMELFKEREKLDLLHVPYPGSPQTITALIGGQVQTAFLVPAAAVPQARDGRFKVLAVSSAERSPTLPEVPTLMEAGVRDFEMISWLAVLLPTGTPQPIVDRLSRELSDVIRSEEVDKQLALQYYTAAAAGPADLAERIRREAATFGAVIKRQNIKLD